MEENKQTPPETVPKKEKKKSGIIFIILAGLFLLIAGYSSYEAWQRGEKNDELISKNNTLIEEKDQLEAELDAKIEELRNMEIENADFKAKLDSSIAELLDMKERLRRAQNKAAEVDRVKGLLWANGKKYEMLSDERDSLLAANVQLTEEKIVAVKNLEESKVQVKSLSAERDKLSTTVAKGKQLRAFDLFASGVIAKSSGKEKTTDKAKKANRLRACFTIGQNAIADAGPKEIFMLVTDPLGKVMSKGESSSFKSSDGEILLYSTVDEIDYNNEAHQMCMYWALKTEAFSAGSYTVEVFADGISIGKTKLSLK